MSGPVIRTRRTVRLGAPSALRGQYWEVYDIRTNRRFTLDQLSALVLVFCMEPRPVDTVRSRVSSDSLVPEMLVSEAMSQLLESGLLEVLSDSGSARGNALDRMRAAWHRNGWTEAFEHHRTTLEFPFIDGSQLGVEEARHRMEGYTASEPDVDRAKVYGTARHRIPLLAPTDPAIADLLAQAAAGMSSNIGLDTLSALLSVTFGPLATLKPKWNGSDLLLKTSPSGGCRHPTEGYLVASNIDGLKPGWYHIQVSPICLAMIDDKSVDAGHLRRCFPSLMQRCPFPLRCTVIITSVFERNMFRYREPRTFRTVHLDAGHIAGTLTHFASEAGIRYFIQYQNEEWEIAKRLDISLLDEGIMLCVGLG